MNLIAFSESRRIAFGPAADVATSVKTWLDSHPQTSVLIFDAQTSQPVEIDLRGALADVLARLPVPPVAPSASAPDAVVQRTAGRPKLGVTAREVTLLPRHWEWLAAQPGGASVALRKLVEQAQRASKDSDRIRAAQEAAYRFMSAMAGNEAGFEEAARALFAGDLQRYGEAVRQWPADIRDHALSLAELTARAPEVDETRV